MMKARCDRERKWKLWSDQELIDMAENIAGCYSEGIGAMDARGIDETLVAEMKARGLALPWWADQIK